MRLANAFGFSSLSKNMSQLIYTDTPKHWLAYVRTFLHSWMKNKFCYSHNKAFDFLFIVSNAQMRARIFRNYREKQKPFYSKYRNDEHQRCLDIVTSTQLRTSTKGEMQSLSFWGGVGESFFFGNPNWHENLTCLSTQDIKPNVECLGWICLDSALSAPLLFGFHEGTEKHNVLTKNHIFYFCVKWRKYSLGDHWRTRNCQHNLQVFSSFFGTICFLSFSWFLLGPTYKKPVGMAGIEFYFLKVDRRIYRPHYRDWRDLCAYHVFEDLNKFYHQLYFYHWSFKVNKHFSLNLTFHFIYFSSTSINQCYFGNLTVLDCVEDRRIALDWFEQELKEWRSISTSKYNYTFCGIHSRKTLFSRCKNVAVATHLQHYILHDILLWYSVIDSRIIMSIPTQSSAENHSMFQSYHFFVWEAKIWQTGCVQSSSSEISKISHQCGYHGRPLYWDVWRSRSIISTPGIFLWHQQGQYFSLWHFIIPGCDTQIQVIHHSSVYCHPKWPSCSQCKGDQDCFISNAKVSSSQELWWL